MRLMSEPCLGWLGNILIPHRERGWSLQLLILNEEFLVNSSHQLVLITSLPFVHTARRSYRLNDPVNDLDCSGKQCAGCCFEKIYEPYHLEEGEVVTRFP